MCDIELEESAEVEFSEANSTPSSSCFSYLHTQLLAPFDIYEVAGFYWKVGVRIFEKDGDFVIIFAMGHLITLFSVGSKERKSVCLHEINIVKIDNDLKGRFMITCDSKCLIVWALKCSEEETLTVLRVLQKPMDTLEIITASISSCGKYIVLVSEPDEFGDYHIQFWLWSFGRKECDDENRIKSVHGTIKDIKFSQNQDEDFFVITMAHTVVFGSWDTEAQSLKLHIPNTKRFNELTSSCYVTKTRYVVSGTTRGRLILWSDLQFEIFNKPVSNEKNFVKAVPLRNCSINDVQMVDEYIATVDACGEIRFYDTEIRLMYHCYSWALPPIYYLAPVPISRKYKLVDVDYEEHVEEFSDEVIYMSDCPKDYSPEAKPFIIRNFVITTTDGQLVYCDVIKNICTFLMYRCESIHVAAEHHPYNNLIATCSSTGRIIYFDYLNYKKVAEYNFEDVPYDGKESQEKEKENEKKPICTSLKMSFRGGYLGIGLSNGAFYLLEPITGHLANEKPSFFTKAAVDRIVFGPKSTLLAYTDTNSTVVLIYFKGTWDFIAKHRYHCKRIVAIFFSKINKKLITIGEDSFLVEYDVQKSIEEKQMVLLHDVRLEQTAKITAAILVPSAVMVMKGPVKVSDVILTANNEYKFKIYDSSSFENLYTVLGTLFESPIHHMIYCSATDSNTRPILIVASNKTLGVALTPLDGNPFRHSGVIVHHKKIVQISSAKNGNYILVQGEGDYGCTIWKVNNENVLQHFESGGEGLMPFCTLLPGGKEGWLFREMQDFFYYIQLAATSEDSPEEYIINDYINLSDTIDYFRAVGYFPSEWESKNILCELKRDSVFASITPTKVSFSDIVKLYLNHKPVDGYKLNDIINAVSYIANPIRPFESNVADAAALNENVISMEQIIYLLSQNAEAVSTQQATQYILELLGPLQTPKGSHNDTVRGISEENEILSTSQFFDIIAFCKTLLGIEVDFNDNGNLYSMFGGAPDPSTIEPKLNNKSNTSLLEKCLPEAMHEEEGCEEDEGENEEEEGENEEEEGENEEDAISKSLPNSFE